MTIFDALIWVGTGLTAIGLGVLVYCIIGGVRLKRAGLDDAGMRAGMARLMAFNMGALAASVIGLMLVIVGIMLG